MSNEDLLPSDAVKRGLRTVVVGGSSKFGGLVCQTLAKSGAAVVIIDWDSSDKATLNALQDSCRSLGAQTADVLTGKLDQEAEWRFAHRQLLSSRFGSPSLLSCPHPSPVYLACFCSLNFPYL